MKLYVGNLPNSITEQELQEVFNAFGEVKSVNIIKDKFTGESRGFGFVEMMTKEAAEQAISDLQGKEVKGRMLKVSEAQPRPERTGGFGGGNGGSRGGFGGNRGGGSDFGGSRGPRRSW